MSRAFGPGSRRFWPVQLIVLGLAATLGLAGCGGSSASGTARPATAQAPPVSASVRAREQAIHQQVQAALRRQSGGAYGPPAGYLPPAPKLRVGRVLSASPAHPALAVEGDAVAVKLPEGSAVLTVVGPRVPPGIPGSAAPRTPASFSLTLTRVDGTLPLQARNFIIVDEHGDRHVPLLRSSGDSGLSLNTVLPVGGGQLRYQPVSGPAVAAWDFDVETD